MWATWLLGGTVATGLALAAIHLAAWCPNSLRLAGWAHGAAGAVGTALALIALWRAPLAPQGSGRLAAAFLIAALVLGAAALTAQRRANRPSAQILVLHAAIGLGGFLLFLL